MKIRVIIKNSANCEIYNKLVLNVADENEAIRKVLEDTTIYTGDSIIIEEE